MMTWSLLSLSAVAQQEESQGTDPVDWQKMLSGHAPKNAPSRLSKQLSGKPKDLSKLIPDPKQATELARRMEIQYSEEEREARRLERVDQLRNRLGKSLDAADRRQITRFEDEERRRLRQARDDNGDTEETTKSIFVAIGLVILGLVALILKIRNSS